MKVWQIAAAVMLAAGTLTADTTSGGAEMAALLERLDGLHSQWPQGQCVQAKFIEQRQFPFRRYPRRLTGVLWFESGGARLAFEYLQPSRMRIIANDGEVYIARGSAAPRRTEEADGDLRMFSQLLGNNPEVLRSEWEVTSLATDDRHHTYTIKPSPGSTQHGYRSIDLQFTATALQSVVVRRDNSVVHTYQFESLHAVDCAEAAAHLNP